MLWFGGFWYTLGEHDALALAILEDLLLVMTLLSLEEFRYMLETLILMP